MSIAAVVGRGYGPDASIAGVVLRGYSIGAAVVVADGVLQTVFVSGAVPSTAVFRSGQAFTQDGELYVCSLPASPVYLDGIAHRADGAMCIATSGSAAFYITGWGVTADGAVLATTSEPEFYHGHEALGGIGLRGNGYVCMSEIS